MLDSIKNLPMDFKPGISFNYTNTGFYVISMIVEAVSGMKLCDYMENEVFRPLGMKNTLIDSAYRLIPNRASGYDIDDRNVVAAPYQCIDWIRGAGSAVGTVDDVYCLHAAARDKLYLKPETWDMIFSPNKGGFGLGCSVSRWHGKIRYTHNGGHLGFRTLHIQLPEDDFGIILLSNMGFGNARNAFSEAIYSIFYETNEAGKELVEMDKGFARNGEVSYPVLFPQRPSLYDCDLEAYIGEYKNDFTHIFVDAEERNGVPGLRITYPDKRSLAVYPIAPGRFFNRTIDESYDFSKSEEGNIIFGGMEKRNME